MSHAAPVEGPAPTRERALLVVSWNVLEGFRRPGTQGLDLGRVEAARELLAELDPEVLVLNEALWGRLHGGRRVDYAELLGYRHQVAEHYDGHWGCEQCANSMIEPDHRLIWDASSSPAWKWGIRALSRIGNMAQHLGIAVATLRRLERCGRLPPAQRTLGGHRRYAAPSVVPASLTLLYARVSSARNIALRY